ncbi:MAG: hypothetical protein KDD28_27000 [Phaeodactylibacter sp.]|nr:hypothetical protein [Phaeodactylibacter sp.]
MDAIRDFYLDKRGRVRLTSKQEEIRQRLVAAHSLLCRFHSPTRAIKKHQKRWELSDVQAWRDIRHAITLFGDVQKAEKEGIRYIIYEFAVETFRMAKKEKDFNAMARAVDTMSKIMGLDKESPDLPDFEKLKPAMIVVGLPEDQVKRLDTMLNTGAVNFSTALPTAEEYLEYEEIGREEEE